MTFTAREDALLGTLAYRGGFLDAGAAGKLAGDLADLLNRFQELSDLPVLALDPTQTTETS